MQTQTLIMDIKILTRIGFYFLVTLGPCMHAYSQRQTLLGLNVNGEVYPNKFRPSVGLTFEKQFTRHSGVETGLFYRTWKSTGIITFTDASGSHTYFFTVSQRHLAVPALYKYYSRLLNFSAGPTLDFYLGWKQKNKGSPVRVESFDVDPKVKVGFLVKASKIIPLSKQFLLEPEIRFGSVQTLEEAGLGIGIAGKYKF